MHKLQQQYLFLSGHDVRSKDELAKSLDVLSGKKKEASSEKSRAYRANQRCADIFAVYNEMDVITSYSIHYTKLYDMISRVATLELGGFMTYASLNKKEATAPGQLAVTDLINCLKNLRHAD